MRKEVLAMIRQCELLIEYLNSDYGLTDEECDAVSHACKAIEMEMLLYRLGKYRST